MEWNTEQIMASMEAGVPCFSSCCATVHFDPCRLAAARQNDIAHAMLEKRKKEGKGKVGVDTRQLQGRPHAPDSTTSHVSTRHYTARAEADRQAYHAVTSSAVRARAVKGPSHRAFELIKTSCPPSHPPISQFRTFASNRTLN
eukprot:552240-Rhodomonas_salina.2